MKSKNSKKNKKKIKIKNKKMKNKKQQFYNSNSVRYFQPVWYDP